MAIDLHEHRLFLKDRKPGTHGMEYCTVLFIQKDRKGMRAKAGVIRLPFSSIYGIDVFATFDGARHWSRSGASKELQAQLEALWSAGKLPLPRLSAEEILKDARD